MWILPSYPWKMKWLIMFRYCSTPEVRENQFLQQEIAQQGGSSADGRDIDRCIAISRIRKFSSSLCWWKEQTMLQGKISLRELKQILKLLSLKEEIAARDYKDSHRKTTSQTRMRLPWHNWFEHSRSSWKIKAEAEKEWCWRTDRLAHFFLNLSKYYF